MSGHDAKYFTTTKKGEIHELKEELNSQYKVRLPYCVLGVSGSISLFSSSGGRNEGVLNECSVFTIGMQKYDDIVREDFRVWRGYVWHFRQSVWADSKPFSRALVRAPRARDRGFRRVSSLVLVARSGSLGSILHMYESGDQRKRVRTMHKLWVVLTFPFLPIVRFSQLNL